MMTNDIRGAVKARRVVRSPRQFSRDQLGRCPHYAADRGLERRSTVALLDLCMRFVELGRADLKALAFERLLAAEMRDNRAGAVRL